MQITPNPIATLPTTLESGRETTISFVAVSEIEFHGVNYLLARRQARVRTSYIAWRMVRFFSFS